MNRGTSKYNNKNDITKKKKGITDNIICVILTPSTQSMPVNQCPCLAHMHWNKLLLKIVLSLYALKFLGWLKRKCVRNNKVSVKSTKNSKGSE